MIISNTSTTTILKSEKGLKNSIETTRILFDKVNKMSFWKKHFRNHHFTFEKERFDWEYWQTIPFFSLSDYLKIGIRSRLADLQPLSKTTPYKFVLRTKSANIQENTILFVDTIPTEQITKSDKGCRILHTSFYALTLKNVLRSLSSSHCFISLDYKKSYQQLSSIQQELLSDITLFIAPSDLFHLKEVFSKADFKQKLQRVVLSQAFVDEITFHKVKSIFTNTEFFVRRPLVEIDMVFRYCKIAQKKFGFYAVHPHDNAIIELRNIGKGNYKEVIITILDPSELAWIRYRTDFLGSAFSEKCSCGSTWTLTLKKMKQYKTNFSEKITYRYQ
jgi:hypothetical protein